MGFYIEELPTEFNGITMQEADYLADEFLKDTPCNRMWDAMRALRDFYETVTSEAVDMADRKTEPSGYKMKPVEQTEPQLTAKCLNCANGGSYKCSKCDGEMYFKDEPQTDCSWK